ncbi:MAG: hypothetical protein JO339_19200 [Alphaproteobacteria bacterium]|nr:hypothetical protein [Alphaproteobacteria bacterium]
MTKQDAVEMQRLFLRAIEALSASLLVAQDTLSSSDYEHRRRSIGSIIGMIQMDLLQPLFADYPELDDLLDRGSQT